MKEKYNEFNYYIHRTSTVDYTKFFENGLYDFDKSFRIGSTMEKISDEDIKNGYLEEILKSLSKGDNTSFLIKIPKEYFPTVIHRDGKLDTPIPIFSEKNMFDDKRQAVDNYPVLIPNLIQGCYSREKGFVTNKNYCPVYDPSGLKFGAEQLSQIKNEYPVIWEEYDKRNQVDFQTLYKQDKSSKVWEPCIKYYSQKFGVKPVIPFNGKYPSITRKERGLVTTNDILKLDEGNSLTETEVGGIKGLIGKIMNKSKEHDEI